jgi:hypothetical protein
MHKSMKEDQSWYGGLLDGMFPAYNKDEAELETVMGLLKKQDADPRYRSGSKKERQEENQPTYGNNKEWFKEMTEAPDSVIKMPPSKPYGPLMEGKHGLDIEEERMRGIEDTWENEAMGEAESYRGSAYDPLYGKSEEDEPESKQMSKGQVQALIKLGGLLSKQAPDAPAQRAPVAGVKMGRTPFPNQNFLRGGKQKREYFRPRGF